MRYLVLTDIHANLEALDACLLDAAARHFDRTLVLGDLVGYCADPNEVVKRVRALDPLAIVRGNHDKVACGLEQADGFNAVARNAARWTADALTAENRAWLSSLPRGPLDVDAVVQICHGSPHDEDAYIFDELDAAQAFKAFSLPLCLFGHTHGAVVFVLSPEGMDAARPTASGRARVELAPGSRYLINPGAVGQPRDGDPRAAYAVVDTATKVVELFRVPYDVKRAQLKITEAGLPEVLAQRLMLGR